MELLGTWKKQKKAKWRELGHMRREYPQKKVGFLKLLVDCQKILQVLEEVPCGCKKLREMTNIPRVTINRRLNFLERLGLVTRKDRKWILATYVKTYKSFEEYEIHREHSWELIKGMLAINEFLPQFVPQHDFYAGDILTEQRKKLRLRGSPEMWPYTLQHIKIGYPSIFNLYEKCVSLLNKVQNVITTSAEKSLESLPDIQSEDISEDFIAEGTNNIDEKTKSSLDLTEEERFKLEEEAAEARSELEHQLSKLILNVRNGEPLSGECNLCPKVAIIEKSGSLQKYSRRND